MKVTVVGMGLIGGSLYKAAIQAGYDATALDRGDAVHVEDADIVLMALPQDVLIDWLKQYAATLKEGAIAVDTCGVKREVCGIEGNAGLLRDFFGGGEKLVEFVD